jgi:DnaJ-class molecular chaperone
MTENIIPAQIKPSYIAQRCPVCNGWGTVSFKRVQCHACGGKGFILVPILKDREKEKA